MSEALVLDHYPFDPAKAPDSWVTVAIAEIARSVISGFPTGAHNSEGKGVPHIRPMNIDREGRFDLSVIKSVDGETPRLLALGDVLFNNTNSPELIGKTTAILVNSPLAYSNHMTRIRLEEGMNPTFVARQLHFLWMAGYFRHRCKNHVNQASIASEPLAHTVPLLVPPSDEQIRIAETLDELLSDLDAGMAALERVQAKLKHYRASVLKAAVAGELTADLRAQHPDMEPASVFLQRILTEHRRRWEQGQLEKFQATGKEPPKGWKAKYKPPVAPETANLPALPEGWCWATFDQITELITKGTSPGWQGFQYQSSGIPFVRSQNVRWGSLDLTNLEYLPPEFNESHGSSIIHEDDVLLNLVGASIGRCAVATRDIHGANLNQAVGIIRLAQAGAFNRWIVTYVTSPHGQRHIHANKAEVARANFNLDDIRPMPVQLPPPAEQEAIVEIVDDQLSVIEHLESDLEAKLKISQALRQSILHRAFSGQLVPQDPSDEPASELLKRIAAEREERARQTAATKQPAKKQKPSLAKSKTPRRHTTAKH